MNRFRRVGRMDSCKNHVTRIGSGQSNLHCLEVANFANQQDIGVLTKGCTQCIAIRQRIHADFALRDNRLVILVKVFDRVFHRDDIDGLVIADMVNHGSKRCRLTRTRRTGHEHKAALGQGHVANDFGQLQVLKRRNLRLDMADNNSNGATLAEHVHTEAAQFTGAHSEVAFLILFKTNFLVAVHDVVQEGIHHHAVDFDIERALQQAVNAECRRSADTDMQVRCLAVHHLTEKVLDAELNTTILLFSH